MNWRFACLSVLVMLPSSAQQTIGRLAFDVEQCLYRKPTHIECKITITNTDVNPRRLMGISPGKVTFVDSQSNPRVSSKIRFFSWDDNTVPPQNQILPNASMYLLVDFDPILPEIQSGMVLLHHLRLPVPRVKHFSPPVTQAPSNKLPQPSASKIELGQPSCKPVGDSVECVWDIENVTEDSLKVTTASVGEGVRSNSEFTLNPGARVQLRTTVEKVRNQKPKPAKP